MRREDKQRGGGVTSAVTCVTLGPGSPDEPNDGLPRAVLSSEIRRAHLGVSVQISCGNRSLLVAIVSAEEGDEVKWATMWSVGQLGC